MFRMDMHHFQHMLSDPKDKLLRAPKCTHPHEKVCPSYPLLYYMLDRIQTKVTPFSFTT